MILYAVFKIVKFVLKALLCILLALVLVVGGYVLYLVIQYDRIADAQALPVQNQQQAVLQTGQAYSALTYNIGFGAYDEAFSFFMDTGKMADGTAVAGKHARAQSAEIVMRNTEGAAGVTMGVDPDFILLQEVDKEADRSFKIDQVAMLQGDFPAYGSVYASNFHSAWLALPLNEPHGAVEAGLVGFSRYRVDEAVRRSFPVDEGFPTKFFDLDRCFTLMRLPVEGGGQLVLINLHMSAYDEGGVIRAAQMEMLCGVLAAERQAGNWVVAGGDFNHALCGTVEAFLGNQQVPQWVAVFDDAALPEGFGVVCAQNAWQVATCRSSDMPYTKGVNYEAVLDGFIVSDNVLATAQNMDTGYAYSDHNPVLLSFTLAAA